MVGHSTISNQPFEVAFTNTNDVKCGGKRSFGFNYIYLVIKTEGVPVCKLQAPVFQKLDRAIHRINLYPLDKY